MDSVPLVAITGQVRTYLIGNDAFQEADVTGITRPATKHNYLVKDARDLGRIVNEAFHIASTGRPGPVLIDLPVDVTAQEVDGKVDSTMQLPGYRPMVKGHGGPSSAAQTIDGQCSTGAPFCVRYPPANRRPRPEAMAPPGASG